MQLPGFFRLTMVWFAPLLMFSQASMWAGTLGPLGTRIEDLNPGWGQYREGLSALEKGQLAEAQRSFKEALVKDPRYAPALLGLGEIELRMGNRKPAEQYFRKAVEVAPRNAGVLTALGRFDASGGQYAAAEKHFREAIEAEPYAMATYLDLGDVYALAYRKPAEALAFYRKAVALQPLSPIPHYRAGLALADLKEYDAAISEFQLAAKGAAENPLPYQEIGRVYAAQKKYGQAIAGFGKAQQIAPGYVGAYLARGDVYAASGDQRAALGDYLKAAQLAPAYAPTHLKLGMFYQGAQRLDDAQKEYLATLQMDPRQPLALNNLAWMAAERKSNLDQALVWARAAADLQPGNMAYQDTLGWVYRARGEYAKAIPVYRAAGSKAPKNGEILFHFGVVLADSGDPAQAALMFRKALEVEPTFSEAEDARRRLAQTNSAPGARKPGK
jgi:tetratricopeptide (TPR) repeat protein